MQSETVYQTLFWIGAIGVGVMGTLSAGAHGHGGHSHAGHDAGHGAAHHGGAGGLHESGHGAAHGTHHAHQGHQAHHDAAHDTHGHAPNAHHAHGHSEASNAGGAANNLAAVMMVLSPMTLFSVSLGTGATGLLLAARFPVALTALLALLGGLALFALVVRPLIGLAQRFVSKPATTLAGVVAGEAVAQNRFDATGQGIVNVSIDGQAVRLLARLEQDDHANGVTVAPGDHLVITQIDEARNTCRVTNI